MNSILECRNNYAKQLSEVKILCNASIKEYEAQLEVEKCEKLEAFRQAAEKRADAEILKLSTRLQVLDDIIEDFNSSTDKTECVKTDISTEKSSEDVANESTDACLEILKNMTTAARPGMSSIEIPSR